MFFNLGGAELLVIAVVALVFIGPEQLPTVMRKVGRFLAQARSMTAGLRDEFMSGFDELEEATKPHSWLGTGRDDDPVVPRGYARTVEGAVEDGTSDFDDGAGADEEEPNPVGEIDRAGDSDRGER
jgi:sec-independent protein translocase protein TatB